MKIIAGPCAVEEPGWWLSDWAAQLKSVLQEYDFVEEFILKASFRKANRTCVDSFRGLGNPLAALDAIWRAGQENGVLTITDVHEAHECAAASPFVDILQIPAFLGRQTYLIEAAAATGRTVAFKKPQWETAQSWAVHARDKTQFKLPDRQHREAPWFIHRGDHDSVVDMVDVADLCEVGATFVDITHTNRQNPRNSRILAGAAATLPITGLFMECHPTPPTAQCDGPHQLDLRSLRQVLDVVASVR